VDRSGEGAVELEAAGLLEHLLPRIEQQRQGLLG
jgi:hypothetical protein